LSKRTELDAQFCLFSSSDDADFCAATFKASDGGTLSFVIDSLFFDEKWSTKVLLVFHNPKFYVD
jgi:hypothetical protein